MTGHRIPLMIQRHIRRVFHLLPLLLLLLPLNAAVPVIFDTDMGNDIDDALALAMLHALADRGECTLLGVTLTNAHPDAVPYVRMLNRFYGRPSIPIGTAMRVIPEGDKDGFLSLPLKEAPADLRQETSSPPPETAVRLLRRLLAQSSEKVAIVQVGFSTNLAALLDSPPDEFSPLPGLELVRQKASLLSAMAGNFVETEPEYNVRLDIPSARKLAADWPTPVVFSGFEIGRALKYPATSIEQDFRHAAWHPIPVSYRAYQRMPYDRPTWDLTSVLYAIRPDHAYFKLSEPGTVTVNSDTGATSFTQQAAGRHRYLMLEPTSAHAHPGSVNATGEPATSGEPLICQQELQPEAPRMPRAVPSRFALRGLPKR
jgi:inosine-uridine nucleoside N-ribohydrolase